MRLPPRLKTRLDTRMQTRLSSAIRAVTRYFRRNEGTTDYGQFAAPIALAGDFSGSATFSTNGVGTNSTIFSGSSNNNAEIVLDVTSGSVRFFAYDSVGVLQGIASVSGSYDDSVLHYAEFSLAGTTASISVDGGVAVTAQWSTFTTGDIAYLYNRNGTQRYFDGIIANLKIWDNGTLTHWLPMDDNSSTLVDKVGGNNATIINGNPEDWQLYTQQENRDWWGQELWTLPEYTFTGSETDGLIIQSENILSTGNMYRVSITTSGANTGTGTRALADNNSVFAGQNTTVSDDIEATGVQARWQVQGTPPFVGEVSVSFKEVLKVA